MKTIQDNINLSEEEKLCQLKEAKGCTWYDGWKPYCLMCDYSGRMDSREYGFQCPKCKNMVGFDLTRLKESPLNKPE